MSKGDSRRPGTGYQEGHALIWPEPKQECKCNLRTKLVGDGCSVCNPKLATEVEEDNRRDAEEAEASGKCPRCGENLWKCVCFPTDDGPGDEDITNKEQP